MSNVDNMRSLRERQPKSKAVTHDSTHDRGEMKEMLEQVDLLSMIRDDTGENGYEASDYIAFHDCPVCGHHDCFRYYPLTNSWHCFSESNMSGYEGGSALEYFKATRNDDDTAAVTWLRYITDHPYEWRSESELIAAESVGEPPWLTVRADDPPERNRPLIDGVVRQGHVILLAGKGKIGKSWSAIELCVAIASGSDSWFGLPLCLSGNCLYIDPEIDSKTLDNRFHAVCDKMGADAKIVSERVYKWSLRGLSGARSMKQLTNTIRAHCTPDMFKLVILDSCSCFVDGDENSSADIRKFSDYVLQIAEITGATVLLVHHFGKAKDGDRDASERARGSSVWLDFPDAVLTLSEITPTDGEVGDYLDDGAYACVLESGGIREFPRLEPVNLIFEHPLHRVDVEGITDGWKLNSSERAGGKATAAINKAKAELNHAHIIQDALAYCYAESVGRDGILVPDLVKALGVTKNTLKAALETSGSDYFEVVEMTKRKHYVVPRHLPVEPENELPFE